jgi:divalent metal cation (Fe/Co/Zn/Cd) transporter
MEYLLLMFIGMAIGLYIVTLYRRKQEELLDDYVDKALEIYKKFTIPLRVDKVDSTYYCYNNDTNDFCCQGKDLEEIKERFQERFPNYGSYILQEYIHMFPDAVDMIVDDPTDKELQEKIKARSLVE